MFTGLIEDVGRVLSVEKQGDGGDAAHRLVIATRLAAIDLGAPSARDDDLPVGASIAVEGTCLTVVEKAASDGVGTIALVAAPETLARTSLGELAAGAQVNLERPLKFGDRLGGHLVAGHVDGVGRVHSSARRGEALDVRIETPPALLRYVVEKGSIAVDGISLTVNEVDERGFTVSLIPHTQTETTLAGKPPGAPINLEVDLIGKYVERLVAPYARSAPPTEAAARGGLTLDKLKEHGFAD